MHTKRLDLQGHRGARGLKPENTLPSFEAALDAGVTSIETDVHLTRDGVPVLVHDPFVSPRQFRLGPGSTSPPPRPRLLVSTLTLAELRGYRADGNPDAGQFPEQDASVTPLAARFAAARGMAPFAPPTIADLLAFVEAYAGNEGTRTGKSDEQRERARQTHFHMEFKRVPFHPELIGDAFNGERPGTLEHQVVNVLRAAGAVDRTTVRSFDHRCVRAIGQLEPRLKRAVLLAGTAPIDPVALVRRAGAQVCCPDYRFLDVTQVRALQAANIRILPWTVNQPEDWEQLVSWGVDGITTDYPDRLVAWFHEL